MSVFLQPEGRIDIRGLSISLGEGSAAFEAVQGLDCLIEPGQFVCILGPSGCGKSTLLGALAGHLQPRDGSLKVDGAPVSGPSPQRGMVFQQHTLFPWRTVRDNVAFGLKMRGIGKTERHKAADEILALVGLEGFAERWPDQLSGGMQQRVEIARVLVNRPRLLLMDEPFGALDALTRRNLQDELLRIWAELKKTVIFVTHSIEEAIYLADRIVVMTYRPGTVKRDMAVDLPRMRDPAAPEFNALKRELGQLVMEEQQRHHEAEMKSAAVD
jgi:NitT/TauT family transport system ATP-binding protein